MMLMTLAVLSLPACAPANLLPPDPIDDHAHVSERAPDFTHAALWKDGLMFGGVTSEVRPWDTATALTYSREVGKGLTSHRFLIRCQPVDAFVQAVGKDRYPHYLEMAGGSTGLDRHAIESLAKRIKGVRYVLFTDVDADNQDRYDHNTYEPDGQSDDVTHNAERTIDLEFVIYDLHRLSVAWMGHVNVTMGRSSSTDVDGDVFDWLLFSGDPATPDDEEMLTQAHQDLLAKLPRPCDGLGFKQCVEVKTALYKQWRAIMHEH